MKSIKKAIIAVAVFGGSLSMTSCGTISCWAYADNSDEKIEKQDIKEATPEWTEATFVNEHPAS